MMGGGKEAIYLFGTIFLCSPHCSTESLEQRLTGLNCSEQSSACCTAWGGTPAGLAAAPPPAFISPPDRKQSLPLFVAAWIHILMVSLIPQKIDLLWGNCYIAVKMKLLLSVVTWAYTPSLTKKREFLHHLVQNTHLPKTTQRTHLATQSSHFPERFNEKVCLKLKIHIYINCR